jgi:integrase
MMIIPSSFPVSENLNELVKKTIEYEKASFSKGTILTYQSRCRHFQKWCEEIGRPFLPTSAETIALYLSSIGQDVSFSTLDCAIAAIEAAHEKAGLFITGDKSLYLRVRKGIRRTHKHNQSIKQAPAISVLDLKGVCCKMSASIFDIRDKAIITLAFFGAFRRSEVSALDFENIEFTEKGITVNILQSKTTDMNQTVYISYAKDKDICPVRALNAWIYISEITSGPIFRSIYKGGRVSPDRLSGPAISDIIKKHFGDEYSGHSTRRGLITASAEKGTPIHVIKKHSRHKNVNMVFTYIEHAKGFDESSVITLGV